MAPGGNASFHARHYQAGFPAVASHREYRTKVSRCHRRAGFNFCGRVHLVNPKSGKVLEAAKK
jgi:hypothetical protein